MQTYGITFDIHFGRKKMTTHTVPFAVFNEYTREEKMVLIALQHLIELDEDHAKKENGQGFKKLHGPFAHSVYEWALKRKVTAKQLTSLRKILAYYSTTQLQAAGLLLPSEQQLQDHLSGETKPTQQNVQRSAYQPYCDVRDGNLYLHTPFSMKEKMDDFREAWEEKSRKREKGFKGIVLWAKNEQKEYVVENGATPEAIAFFTLPQWFPQAHITTSAQEMKRQFELELAEQLRAQHQVDDKRKQEYFAVLSHLDLSKPIGPYTLYKHQVHGVKFVLWARRCVIGDQMGVGKTLESLVAAKALQEHYGYTVVVITKKSLPMEWMRTAQKIGVAIEVYIWGSIPEYKPEWGEFVLIQDEAHYAKTWSSQRTTASIALALNHKCKSYMALTGTPLANMRPIEAFPLLYMCKHPRVYSSSREEFKAKRKEYERLFCAAHVRKVTKTRQIYDTSGSSNLVLWHKLYVYHYGAADNDPHACIIARRLSDTDVVMPALNQIMRQVVVTDGVRQTYIQTLQRLKDSFENNLKTKLEAYIIEYTEKYRNSPTSLQLENKEAEIRRAETMVLYQAMLMAGAWAKVDGAVEDVEAMLEDDNKVVVFTNFPAVGQAVADKISEKYGDIVAYVNAQTSTKKRDEMQQDFQNEQGKYKVFIGTRASGEGITLTKAHYLILMDRWWTPGSTDQVIGRIKRIGQQETMFVYWLQMPESVSRGDIRVDALIEQKQRGINTALYNEDKGIEFTQALQNDILAMAEDILQETLTLNA